MEGSVRDGVVAVGAFSGRTSFQSAGAATTLDAVGGPSDVFVARYAESGNLTWVARSSGPATATPT